MGQLEDMQVFVRIVDAGSISHAAEQLNIAKSAVSRRLSELEKRLGVTLINRTTRNSNLTSAGQNYYKRSQQLISEVDELNNLTSDPDFSLKGTLRMSVPLSFGLTHLTSVLDTFAKEHSGLTLEIEFEDTETDLIEGGFDLALRIGPLNDSSLKSRTISPIHHLICASPEYIEQYGAPETPEELRDHQILKYGLGTSNTWMFVDNAGIATAVHIKSKITANNGDFLTDLAIKNHGIIKLPRFIAWKAVENGELIPLLTDYEIPEITAQVVYPQTRFPSRKVRLFIDHLIDCFGDNPYWDDYWNKQ